MSEPFSFGLEKLKELIVKHENKLYNDKNPFRYAQTLMLAQAQRAFYDKAVSENLGGAVRSKLAAGAADLFSRACTALRRGQRRVLRNAAGARAP